MTPAQAEKLNKALAGEAVDLTPEEADLMNQALGHAPAAPPRAQPVPSEPDTLSPRSGVGTAVRHLGKGASFGFIDEIAGLQGAADEVTSRAWRAVGAEPPAGLQETSVSPSTPLFEALAKRYRHERDDYRRDLDIGAKENPKTALAAELIGGAAAPVPGAGVTKGMGIAQKIGRYGAQGLAAGTLGGVGNSTADLTRGDVGGVARDAAIGGGIGLGVGATLGTAMDVGAGKLATVLQRKAEDKVLLAINNPGISDKLVKMGLSTEEARREFARKALASGLIQFGDDAASIAARADDFINNWGTVIGDITEKADVWNKAMMSEAAARNAEKVSAATKVQDAYDRALTDQRLAQFRGQPPPAAPPGPPPVPPSLEPVKSAVSTPDAAEAMRRTLAQRTNVERMGEGPTLDLIERVATEPQQTFDALRRAKSSAQGAVNWSDQAPQSKEIFRDATRTLRDEYLRQIEPVIGPNEMEMLKMANESYGLATDVANLATDKASREAGKSAVGAREMAAGAAAATALGGGPLGAGAGTLLAGAIGHIGRRLPASTANAAKLAAREATNLPSPLAKAAEFEALQKWLTPEEDEKKRADDFKAAMTGKR